VLPASNNARAEAVCRLVPIAAGAERTVQGGIPVAMENAASGPTSAQITAVLNRGPVTVAMGVSARAVTSAASTAAVVQIILDVAVMHAVDEPRD